MSMVSGPRVPASSRAALAMSRLRQGARTPAQPGWPAQVDGLKLRDYQGDYEEYLRKNEQEAEVMADKASKARELEKSQIKSKSKVRPQAGTRGQALRAPGRADSQACPAARRCPRRRRRASRSRRRSHLPAISRRASPRRTPGGGRSGRRGAGCEGRVLGLAGVPSAAALAHTLENLEAEVPTAPFLAQGPVWLASF